MRIVVTGLIASYPLGGVSWDYVQYIQGLQLLGHDVIYLEDTGQWVYNPDLRSFTEDCSFNLRYLEKVLAFLEPDSNDSLVLPQPARRIFRTCRA